MGYLMSIIFFVCWIFNNDSSDKNILLIASSLFAIAGSIEFIATSIKNKKVNINLVIDDDDKKV